MQPTIDCYEGLYYRVCYGLTENGAMDYSIPFYQFTKNCRCEYCKNRLYNSRKPSNHISITTDNKNDFPEIKRMIKNYTCEEKHFIGYKCITMQNSKRTEKIL